MKTRTLGILAVTIFVALIATSAALSRGPALASTAGNAAPPEPANAQLPVRTATGETRPRRATVSCAMRSSKVLSLA